MVKLVDHPNEVNLRNESIKDPTGKHRGSEELDVAQLLSPDRQYLQELTANLYAQRGSEKIPILVEIADEGEKASPLVKDILSVLQDTQVADITIAAMRALAAIGVQNRGISSILREKLLGDELHDVRLAAAETLGAIGKGKEDRSALKSALELDHADIKEAAKSALALLKVREKLPEAESSGFN